MGDIADFYRDEWEMEQFMEDMFKNHDMSNALKSKVKRYDVTDDEIREFLFELSVKQLCLLADKVLMEYYPEESETEFNKILDIAAFGLSRKYLTVKQSWCLGSFCLYWLQQGKLFDPQEVELEEDDF